MKKTYADECLERAEKASRGAWSFDRDGLEEDRVCSLRGTYVFNDDKVEWDEDSANGEFIAHARTDVPELARRLKGAITLLMDVAGEGFGVIGNHDRSYIRELATRLEEPLEKGKK